MAGWEPRLFSVRSNVELLAVLWAFLVWAVCSMLLAFNKGTECKGQNVTTGYV
jgi:hypothetical protein